MPLKRRLTREQQLLGAHADYHAPRQAPPPLAPRPVRHTICGRLPSFSDLVVGKSRHSIAETEDICLGNSALKQYEIVGKPFVMAHVAQETDSYFERTTAEGRKLTYHLEVVQKPQRARACGSGPRSSADRRPVDPPPVVKLTVHHGNVDITASYEANFMLFASLEFSRPVAAGRGMLNTVHCPVLTGVCVAGAAYLAKPYAAAYFIFSDLSVRHEGWYRLKFHLFEQNKRKEDLDLNIPLSNMIESTSENPQPPNSQEQMANRMYVYSEPFQVFSAKKFPGLQNSTQLSQQLADQGIRVRIRREIRQRTDKGRKGTGKYPEDEQRSIRSLSHDRAGSIDGYAYPPDTRRPSVDSSASQSYGPSRHQSFSQSTISSPITAVPSSQYSQPSYNPGEPISAAPADPWNSQYSSPLSQHPPQSMPPPQLQRPAYATPTPPPNLPSIASMINPAPEPVRPQGGYYAVPSPAAKKRVLNKRDGDTSLALKDRARPSLTPNVPTFSMDGRLSGGLGAKFPLASGEDVIEADDDDDDGSHSDGSEDDILNLTHTYKRAAGGYAYVPRV